MMGCKEEVKKIRYVIQKAIHLDYQSFFRSISKASERSGKSKIWIFMDMVYSGFKYKAGYTDYLAFDFYSLDKEARRTYITRGLNEQYILDFNDLETRKNIENKAVFLKTHHDLMKRSWFYLDENSHYTDFESFYNRFDEIVVKPVYGVAGSGIEFYRTRDHEPKVLFQDLIEKGAHVVEEVIQQHHLMNKMNPGSVNTMRVVTLKNNNQIFVPAIGLRIGYKERVDNFAQGGIVARVHKEKGFVDSDGVTVDGKTYAQHPITKTRFQGFKIPYYKEAMALVREGARRMPKSSYIGWDVAISENGPLIIEANALPSYAIFQYPALLDDRSIGLRPRFDGFIQRSGGFE